MVLRVFLGVGVLLAVSIAAYLYAASLTSVRDLISTSAPSADATHTVQFTATQAIPASGKIVITPQSNQFVIPGGLNHYDVDFEVSTGGPFSQRTLATSTSATEDSVSVVSGTQGSVTINLNASSGIAAGSVVRVTIGEGATYPEAGLRSIQNPTLPNSYIVSVATKNASNATIDSATAMIAIVNQVTTELENANIPPARSSGLPTSTVAANNPYIEISLDTDELASCRYSTTAGVEYDSMTNDMFSINGFTFYANINGHANSTTYTYYVRCSDLYGTVNDDDYVISFALAATPISNTSIQTDKTSSGQGGTGPFPNGSSVLYLATVTFSGYASPLSTITVLRDGAPQEVARARSDGYFTVTATGMERGAYTFMVYATDNSIKSASYSSTMSLGQGTNNAISNIVIPPIIMAEKDTAATGESVRIFGTTVPGAQVELFVATQGASPSTAKRYMATSSKANPSSADGFWEITVPGRDLAKGTYSFRARTIQSPLLQSPMSSSVYVGIGGVAAPSTFNRSDINRDGKVNLVDFSIMLSFWGTDDADADINQDGIVNLADFSIMLFNWTG